MKLKLADLKEKKILIAGLTGSGKTEAAKFLSKKFKTVVYTPHPDEWKKENVYLYRGNFLEDFEPFMKNCKKWGKEGKIKMVIVDESDLLYNNKQAIKTAFKDFLINHRHYNIGLIMITRRPQNLPTQIYEEFHHMFLFSFESPNVTRKLNQIYEGLGDLVKTLKFREHKFVLKTLGEAPVISKIRL